MAGCRIDVKNDQGISAEIAALAQGHKDTSDLLKRLKRVRMYTTIKKAYIISKLDFQILQMRIQSINLFYLYRTRVVMITSSS